MRAPHTSCYVSALSLWAAVLTMYPVGAAAGQGSRSAIDARARRFCVLPDRLDMTGEAAGYCEEVVRRTGIARLVRSASDADYLLYPSTRVSMRVEREEHPGKKKEDKTHYDDVLRVTVHFACDIERVSDYGRSRNVAMLDGWVRRSTLGPRTPGHAWDDPPIRLWSFETYRLLRDMSSPEGNSAEPELYKEVFDLCNMVGHVSRVERERNRITIDLGSDDGIQAKNSRFGVTEMELFAQTGRLQLYSYVDSITGKIYVADRKSVEARPDSPRDWAYEQEDSLPGRPRLIVRGPVVDDLVPLGERLTGWAEAQEVFRDSCTVAPKRKGDLGRTRDDEKAFQRIPDPAAVPMVARVRVKHGILQQYQPIVRELVYSAF